MTLDEAIKLCEERAEAFRGRADYYHRTRQSAKDKYREGMKDRCLERAKDHEQLAEWLKELKEIRKVVKSLLLRTIGKKIAEWI